MSFVQFKEDFAVGLSCKNYCSFFVPSWKKNKEASFFNNRNYILLVWKIGFILWLLEDLIPQ